MNEVNFSLLTQEEIDVLVAFIMEQQKNVGVQVLSQESIDKLITLVKNNQMNRMRLDLNQLPPVSTDLLKELELISDTQKFCELQMEEEGNYIQLFAVKAEADKKYKITPEGFRKRSFVEDGSSWGYCIAPVIFDEIASAFKLKYTKETYEKVCKRFACKNFGDETYEIPKTFLVDDMGLLQNLI